MIQELCSPTREATYGYFSTIPNVDDDAGVQLFYVAD